MRGGSHCLLQVSYFGLEAEGVEACQEDFVRAAYAGQLQVDTAVFAGSNSDSAFFAAQATHAILYRGKNGLAFSAFIHEAGEVLDALIICDEGNFLSCLLDRDSIIRLVIR